MINGDIIAIICVTDSIIVEEEFVFGYVNINKPELKVKEFYKYKAYYCGLCHQLKKRHGRLGQMTLSYDMTFLIIVLTSLYERQGKELKKRCMAHPTSKHWILINDISDYASDMNVALMYHKMMDDWQDDKKITSRGMALMLQRQYRKIEHRYERQCKVIAQCLKDLQLAEKQNETNLDIICRPFGELMGELFVYREDEWQQTLRRMGFFLGKFVYLLDAYDDLSEDIKTGNYNPLKVMSETNHYEEQMYELLTSLMAECTKEFEKLPLLWDVELLRNILYAGVWKKYEDKRKKQLGERKEI